MKTLVIKLMNVGRRAGVNISFLEYKSATVRDILMILGGIIEQVNANSRA